MRLGRRRSLSQPESKQGAGPREAGRAAGAPPGCDPSPALSVAAFALRAARSSRRRGDRTEGRGRVLLPKADGEWNSWSRTPTRGPSASRTERDGELGSRTERNGELGSRTETATAGLLPDGLWGHPGIGYFIKRPTLETGTPRSCLKCPRSRLAFLGGAGRELVAEALRPARPRGSRVHPGQGRSRSRSPSPAGLPAPTPGVLGPGGVRVCLVAERPAAGQKLPAPPNSSTSPSFTGEETGLSFLPCTRGRRRGQVQSCYADEISERSQSTVRLVTASWLPAPHKAAGQGEGSGDGPEGWNER